MEQIDGLSDRKRYYKDFESDTRKVASYFKRNGLCKFDIVIYLATIQYDQLILMTGIWRANGIVRTLYPDESKDTILRNVKESKAKWIFCDAVNSSICLSISKECDWLIKVVLCGSEECTLENGLISFNTFFDDDGTACKQLDVGENDVAIILPTSGTTGPSKGAMHNHKSFLAQINLISHFPFTHPKPNLVASKGTHISGALFPYSVLAMGGTIIVLPQVNKEILIKVLDKYKPGFVNAFPSFLTSIRASDAKGLDITSIEVILTGGSPLTSAFKKDLLKLPNVHSIVNAYGLTEGCTVASTVNFSKDRQTANDPNVPQSSVGRPYPGVEIQIRDASSGEVLSANQEGIIWAKGEFTFVGYFQNPNASKETIVDGWFQTGDVGYYDDQGYLFIVDRAKDIFKYFHNHISPSELESVICEHSQVKEACIVPIIADEGGEVPRAFVTLKENSNCQDFSLLAEQIKQFANEKLATYKHLRGGLFIVDDLPRGKTGKVTRNLVAQIKVYKNEDS